MASARNNSAFDNWPGIFWLARDHIWPNSSRGKPEVSRIGYKTLVSINPPAFNVDWEWSEGRSGTFKRVIKGGYDGQSNFSVA